MDQQDAINLIKGGAALPFGQQVWVDLGCGKGTFTEALASLLPKQSVVYAIDKKRSDLNTIPNTFGSVSIKKVKLDFLEERLPVKNVDGIIMANSLHYIRDKASFLKKLLDYLTANGSLVIVEYEARYSNPWVPYPIAMDDLRDILVDAGFRYVRKLGSMKSRYGHLIYSMSCSSGRMIVKDYEIEI